MRKVIVFSCLLLIPFVGVAIINAKLVSNLSLQSPQPDQAVVSINNPQTSIGKTIQPETTLVTLADIDPASKITAFTPIDNSPTVDLVATPVPSTTPEPSPSPIESAAPKPVTTPTPLPSKDPTSSPTPAPVAVTTVNSAPAGSLNGDKIFDLINQYRTSKNLSTLQKDDRSCQLAQSRAPEIMNEVNTGTMHKGLADRNLPYWDNENIAYYNTEQETVSWWIADTIHRKQLEGNFKYSCVACYNNSCAEELTNFAPK